METQSVNRSGSDSGRDDELAREFLAPRRCTLPNGMEISYQSRAEVDFFYHDVIEKEVYLQHGVTVKDGDCIFDVGANIGFFTLFIHQKCTPSAVYSFEPAPPLFRILSDNASRYGKHARLFNFGLSNAPKTANFTFYPNSSGMSSFYGDKEEEKEALKAIMLNQLRNGMAEMEQVLKHADDLLEERFRSQTFACQLRTLSDVISEHNVGRIDLLKIDVQKSELDVLAGIRDDDWAKIRQIVLEVHDTDGRLTEVSALLRRHGYDLTVEQDDLYEGSTLYNLFAVRRSSLVALDRLSSVEQAEPHSFQQINDRARRQENALSRQRQLMKKRRND